MQGEKALPRGEVPVGAVFVFNGEIIARSANRVNELFDVRLPFALELCLEYSADKRQRRVCVCVLHSQATKHAEVVAIEAIAATYGADALRVLAATTLYVTCEPCIMCAGALAHVRIQKVYFGCHNDRFGGCGSVLNLHDKMCVCVCMTS